MLVEKWLLVGWLLISIREGDSKTVYGVISSYSAYQERGAYITKFCYHRGTGKIWYSLNDTTDGALYLFLDEQWPSAVADDNCTSKLAKARIKVGLEQRQGQQSIAERAKPHYWYVLYAEPGSCDASMPVKDNYVSYELHFYNPDYHGNPTDHFGAEQRGLQTCYNLFVLLYLVVIVLWGQKVWQIIIKGGPMHSVLKMLSFTVIMEFISSLLMALYYWSYSSNGVGVRVAERLSHLLDTASQLHMYYMILMLSCGWPLSSTRTFKWTHYLIVVMVITVVLQLFVLLWEQTCDEPCRDGWWLLGLERLLLTALFYYNLRSSAASERSALRLDFIHKFSIACYMWLISYPANLLVAMVFAYYWRHAFMTVGVSILQMAAMAMLGRLFLSRSLYWEVSSLSASTLPLHGDRSFGSMKFRNYRSFN